MCESCRGCFGTTVANVNFSPLPKDGGNWAASSQRGQIWGDRTLAAEATTEWGCRLCSHSCLQGSLAILSSRSSHGNHQRLWQQSGSQKECYLLHWHTYVSFFLHLLPLSFLYSPPLSKTKENRPTSAFLHLLPNYVLTYSIISQISGCISIIFTLTCN